jgi:hypothetical protein
MFTSAIIINTLPVVYLRQVLKSDHSRRRRKQISSKEVPSWLTDQIIINRKQSVHFRLNGGGADAAAEGHQAVAQQLVLGQLAPRTRSCEGACKDKDDRLA